MAKKTLEKKINDTVKKSVVHMNLVGLSRTW